MNYDDRPSWRLCVQLAPHYLAVGQKELYLYDRETTNDMPWGFVSEAEPGGGHRLDVATSVRIKAVHPCGLTFAWSVDIEKREANGHGYYVIDMELVRRIIAYLPAEARDGFRTYLRTFANALTKNATEYRQVADREFAEAATLGDLAGFSVGPPDEVTQ
jgi:hypothetical protein